MWAWIFPDWLPGQQQCQPWVFTFCIGFCYFNKSARLSQTCLDAINSTSDCEHVYSKGYHTFAGTRIISKLVKKKCGPQNPALQISWHSRSGVGSVNPHFKQVSQVGSSGMSNMQYHFEKCQLNKQQLLHWECVDTAPNNSMHLFSSYCEQGFMLGTQEWVRLGFIRIFFHFTLTGSDRCND